MNQILGNNNQNKNQNIPNNNQPLLGDDMFRPLNSNEFGDPNSGLENFRQSIKDDQNQFDGLNYNNFPTTNSKTKLINNTNITTAAKVFAIIIIVLGVIFIADGAYMAYANQPKKEDVPEVHIEQIGTKLTITAYTKLPLKAMSYRWDNEEVINLVVSPLSPVKQEIRLGVGNKMLKLTITDYYGNETHYHKQYINNYEDVTDPVMEISQLNDKLILKASDDKGIAYLTYCWNDGEIVKVEANENEYELSTEVELEQGEKTIECIAYDLAGNQCKYRRKVKAINKPEFNVSLDEDNMQLIIAAKDAEGVKQVVVKIDDQEYKSEEMNQKEVTVKVPISSGRHSVEVTVTSIYDLSETKRYSTS